MSGSDHWAFRLPRDTNRNRNTTFFFSQPPVVNLGGAKLTTNERMEEEEKVKQRTTTALLVRSEDEGSGESSDEDAAVALNGDWVKYHFTITTHYFLASFPIVYKSNAVSLFICHRARRKLQGEHVLPVSTT